MKRLLWLLPLLFVAVTSAAPSIPQQGAAALSAFLKNATDRGDVPGVVIAVVDKAGNLYNEAFGLSSMLRSTPMTKDTIFNMASMTKPVTSVAIMMLVDEGKLKLESRTGSVVVKEQQSANLGLSKNFPVGAGKDHGDSAFSSPQRRRRTDAPQGAGRGPASSTRTSSSIRVERSASSS